MEAYEDILESCGWTGEVREGGRTDRNVIGVFIQTAFVGATEAIFEMVEQVKGGDITLVNMPVIWNP